MELEVHTGFFIINLDSVTSDLQSILPFSQEQALQIYNIMSGLSRRLVL